MLEIMQNIGTCIIVAIVLLGYVVTIISYFRKRDDRNAAWYWLFHDMCMFSAVGIVLIILYNFILSLAFST